MAFTIIIALCIKFYFKPFLSILIIYIVCRPLYSAFVKLKISKPIAGAITLIMINLLFILLIIYMGSAMYEIIKKVYTSNIELINSLIQNISSAAGVEMDGLKIGKSLISVMSSVDVKGSAANTGELILAYFVANVCTFFILVDKNKILDVLKRIFPENAVLKTIKHKNNFINMISIQGGLVLISTLEIIFGFAVLKVPKPLLLGTVCGILDLLPYVGTIIVFIPIIIYNIMMKRYIIAIGLICLYILVQVVREILEAKFLGNTLDVHPIIIFISIYIGAKIFGILGILIGPMYSIIAKDIIYDEFEEPRGTD